MIKMKEGVNNFNILIKTINENNFGVIKILKKIMSYVLNKEYVITKKNIVIGTTKTPKCIYYTDICFEYCLFTAAKKENILNLLTLTSTIFMAEEPSLTAPSNAKDNT